MSSFSPRMSGRAQHFTSPALASRLDPGYHRSAPAPHDYMADAQIEAQQATAAAASPAPTSGFLNNDLRIGRGRLMLLALLFMLGYLAIGARLVWLTGLDGPQVASVGQTPAAPVHKRADILDRNGAVLAKTLYRPALVAHPRKIRDVDEAFSAIMQVVPDLNPTNLLERLSNTDRVEVQIKRNLTPSQVKQLNSKGIIGLYYPKLPSRHYPNGDLFSHPVGYTDIDTKGLAGMEYIFEGQLSDLAKTVKTSLDVGLQYIVKSELETQMEAFQAKRAAAVLMDVNSGEVLSMVSLPSFDPADPTASSRTARRNSVTQGAIELGSTFKLFTIAAALDRGAITTRDTFDVSKPLHVVDRVINDYHRYTGRMDAKHILQESSNIGAAQIGLQLGGDQLRSFLDDLGMLSISQVEVPEIDTPQFPARMTDVSTATVSYGHGIAVSPLHVAAGVAALANGGIRVEPTLLKASEPSTRPMGPRVLSQETSHIMLDFMRSIVASGTGKKARVESVAIGGKTGTADKYGSDEVVSSFVSVFPIDNPKYVLYVVFDEPKGRADTFNFATGGWVAAPVTCRIINRLISPLGIMPVRNTDDMWQMMQKTADSQDPISNEPASCN